MNSTGNNTANVPRNMSNDSCETEMENSVEKVINIVGYSVIILVSLVGNPLLICSVKRNSRLNTKITYCLIINMAAADILVTVCNMPGRLTRQITGRYHWFGGIPGIIVCKSASFISDSTVSCSILTLTAIAFERFCLVTFPLKKITTIRIVKFMILAIWMTSFLSVSPLLYAMSIKEIDGVIYCYEDWSPLFDQETAAKVYTVIMFVLLYALPLLIICVLYSCVVYKIWIRPVPVACRSNRAGEIDARKKVLKMLIIVVVVFALCWLPLHISLFLYFFQTKKTYLCGIPQGGFSIGSVGLFLSHATSAINPCLYVVFNKDIRKGFQNIISSCLFICHRWCS
ncbi:substance-P receptor-like [Oculina patagonica]